MEAKKLGALIAALRKEKHLTQAELANKLNITDKAVSRWERGMGCPDVSLLKELSAVLNVNIERLLEGELDPNEADGGNMKKLNFYICPDCGNIITSTGKAEISCCGRRLAPLKAKPADDTHFLSIEATADEYYVTFSHEMTKEHYISFIAYVSFDKAFILRLYPEQSNEAHIPRMRGGKFYFCCNKDGLWMN